MLDRMRLYCIVLMSTMSPRLYCIVLITGSLSTMSPMHCADHRPTEYNVAGDFTFTPASGKKRKREGLEQSPEKRVGLEQSQEKRKRKREVLEQSGEILDDESGGNTEGVWV